MEKIRLIKTRFNEYRIQQEINEFHEEKIISHWVNRDEDYNIVSATRTFNQIIKNGLPLFFGDDFFTTEPKEIILEDCCKLRNDFDWKFVLENETEEEVFSKIKIKTNDDFFLKNNLISEVA